VPCVDGSGSRLPYADFCAQLRGAPRSNPAQRRHAKDETVSHAEFIALLRAKAPKLNRRAERCTNDASKGRPYRDRIRRLADAWGDIAAGGLAPAGQLGKRWPFA
jgi:hypothetical protein